MNQLVENKTIGQEKRDLSKVVFNLTNAAMWSDSFQQEEKQMEFDQYLVNMFQRWRDCRDNVLKTQFLADKAISKAKSPESLHGNLITEYKTKQDYVPRATFEDATAQIKELLEAVTAWKELDEKNKSRIKRQRRTIHDFYMKFDHIREVIAESEVSGG